MTAEVVAALAVIVFAWSITSGVLARRNITGPLLFAVAGYVLCNPTWGPFSVNIESAAVHVMAELALALLLFSDAARVNLRELRRDLTLPVRLLGIGLPLCIALGGMLAARLLIGLPWALAGFLGASLAPTDAALSAQVINDDRVPLRLRRALNVESGLNDGIATPVVTVMLALAASQLGLVADSGAFEVGIALRDIAIAVAVGIAVGALGALALNIALRRAWVGAGGRRLAAFALGIGAFVLADTVNGNPFIASFVAGIAFAAAIDEEVVPAERALELTELTGELLALVVWFLFGAALLPIAFDYADARIAVYAVLSLTVIRMAPVFLSMWGSGLDRPTTTFLAWFGPRGLASIVFSLLAVEELGLNIETKTAVGAVALTVALSVLLHGVTAGPGGRAYVRRESAEQGVSPRARHGWSTPPPHVRARSSARSSVTRPQPARRLAAWSSRFRYKETIADVYRE